MKERDYNELTGEIADHLEKSINIVLATCADGIVTGRTMNHINDGLNVIFSTSAGSEKTSQIRANKNVALVCGPLQIQAVAEFCGTLAGNEAYSEKYYKKFPWLVNAFLSDPEAGDNSVLVVCRPKNIRFYKYLDRDAHWDILDIENHKAYRI